jgi:predicted Zn-dependent protease
VKLALSLLRPLVGIVLGLAAILALSGFPSHPAHAQPQGIALIRDTEVERVLRGYLDPLLEAAGLRPGDVRLYIVNDPSINAFVAEGQNMFVNTGILMTLDTPNEVTGVMAHETGHIQHGDLVRAAQGMRAAMVPMLLSMAIGVAVMAVGGGDAGAAILMGGQQIAERTFLAYSRTVEAAADQAGVRLLNATHQSGQGMLKVFQRFEGEEVLSAERQDPFAMNHPAPAQRIADLQALVDASPYRDVKDPPEKLYEFYMIRAKLRGYILQPDVVLRLYPSTDNTKPAHYARAMAYFRMPDMPKALNEVETLLKDEPKNPYFLEMYGQIKVEMGKVAEGIQPYREAVQELPDAPLIRVALAAAMLGTENPQYTKDAVTQLETALKQEKEDAFAWYELAQGYARLGQTGKAELATAERYYLLASYPQAMQFAGRAQKLLVQGSTEWQRASDIVSIAQTEAKDQKNR